VKNQLLIVTDFDNFRKRTAQDAERRAAAKKEAFICHHDSVAKVIREARKCSHNAVTGRR